MRSDGQNLALQQLKEIESSNNYVINARTSITQKCQDIDYLNGYMCQDIDYPASDK